MFKESFVKKVILIDIKVPGFDEFDELYFIEESRRRVVLRQGFRYRLNFINFKLYSHFFTTRKIILTTGFYVLTIEEIYMYPLL